MATEREEVQYEGGRGGKFQKRPIRRSHTTPYDRPPTALRNSAAKGWLSKLVDPAQKLITSSAHRLFSTVFRKRLPPPPPSFSLSRGFFFLLLVFNCKNCFLGFLFYVSFSACSFNFRGCRLKISLILLF